LQRYGKQNFIKQNLTREGVEDCNSAKLGKVFTIAKLWKQPRCPTTDEWIKKM
jgi:hypothetical protein